MMQKISAEIAESAADSAVQYDVLTFLNLTVGELRLRFEKAPRAALDVTLGRFIWKFFASLGLSKRLVRDGLIFFGKVARAASIARGNQQFSVPC